jgi:hypothetical protein
MAAAAAGRAPPGRGFFSAAGGERGGVEARRGALRRGHTSWVWPRGACDALGAVASAAAAPRRAGRGVGGSNAAGRAQGLKGNEVQCKHWQVVVTVGAS